MAPRGWSNITNEDDEDSEEKDDCSDDDDDIDNNDDDDDDDDDDDEPSLQSWLLSQSPSPWPHRLALEQHAQAWERLKRW